MYPIAARKWISERVRGQAIDTMAREGTRGAAARKKSPKKAQLDEDAETAVATTNTTTAPNVKEPEDASINTTTATKDNAKPTPQIHPLARVTEGMNRRSLLTGLYGPRGERIKHVVANGALSLPQEALDMMASVEDEMKGIVSNNNQQPQQTSSKKKRKSISNPLPGLDSVVRPTRDKKLKSFTVTDIFHKQFPNANDPLLPPTLRTVAANRIVENKVALSSGPERIRGGGENEESKVQDASPAEETTNPTATASGVAAEPPAGRVAANISMTVPAGSTITGATTTTKLPASAPPAANTAATAILALAKPSFMKPASEESNVAAETKVEPEKKVAEEATTMVDEIKTSSEEAATADPPGTEDPKPTPDSSSANADTATATTSDSKETPAPAPPATATTSASDQTPTSSTGPTSAAPEESKASTEKPLTTTTTTSSSAPEAAASAESKATADQAPRSTSSTAPAAATTTAASTSAPAAADSVASAPVAAPVTSSSTAAATTKEPVPQKPSPAARRSSALVPAEAATSKVIPLTSKPNPQWEQMVPAASDENPTDPQAKAPKPDWFNPTGVSNFERVMLPEWFDESAAHRTEDAYLKARSTMIHISDQLGNRFVTATLARRSLPGDVGSLHRLHSFLTHYLWINEDARNDSAPTAPSLQSPPQLTPKVWTEKRRGELIEAVVEASQQQQPAKKAKTEGVADDPMDVDAVGQPPLDDSNSFVPIDWDAVAEKVGASAQECEREFLAMPMDEAALSTAAASDRPITPDTLASDHPPARTMPKTAKDEMAQEELLRTLVEGTSPHVIKAVTVAALRASGNDLPAARRAARLGLVAGQAARAAQAHEETVSRLLSEVIDQRMQKLEARMALMDDLEGMLEAERVALELERRDLYTTRCRDWFGGS